MRISSAVENCFTSPDLFQIAWNQFEIDTNNFLYASKEEHFVLTFPHSSKKERNFPSYVIIFKIQKQHNKKSYTFGSYLKIYNNHISFFRTCFFAWDLTLFIIKINFYFFASSLFCSSFVVCCCWDSWICLGILSRV